MGLGQPPIRPPEFSCAWGARCVNRGAAGPRGAAASCGAARYCRAASSSSSASIFCLRGGLLLGGLALDVCDGARNAVAVVVLVDVPGARGRRPSRVGHAGRAHFVDGGVGAAFPNLGAVGRVLHLVGREVIGAENLAVGLHVLMHGHGAFGAALGVFHLPALHGGAAHVDGALQGEASDRVLGAVVLPVAQKAGLSAFQGHEVPAPDEVHVIALAAGDRVGAARPRRVLDVGKAHDVLVGHDVGGFATHARAVPVHEVARHEGIGHLPFVAQLVAVVNRQMAEPALEPLTRKRARLGAAPLVDPWVHLFDRAVDGDGRRDGFHQFGIEAVHKLVARVDDVLLFGGGVVLLAPGVDDPAADEHGDCQDDENRQDNSDDFQHCEQRGH